MDTMPDVQIVVVDDFFIPIQGTLGSAGLDLSAYQVFDPKTRKFLQDLPIEILPGKRVLIWVGIKIAIPNGFYGQIVPRSGWASKYGVTILNSPATIDSDYRGPVMVLLVNFGDEPFVVERGTKIAQMVFLKFEKPNLKKVNELDTTGRGEDGFGHTG